MLIKTPSFWYATRKPADRFWPVVLAPLGKIYGWAVRKRFDMHYPIPLAKPVVCIGNIVAGGAGKTPVVLSLTGLLIEKGYNPHILSRGYGGAEEGPLQVSPGRDTAADVGDEPLLLVEKAPTWVAKSRALGAQAAIDTGADIIVMDDGFQNPALYKDFSLLVIDGAAGFGNGRVMPAGPLREEVSFALERADAVVIVGADKAGVAVQIARYRQDLPVLGARLTPTAENPDLSGKTVYAFAGIGRPEKFRETLEAAGAQLEGWAEFPDHFSYLAEDLAELFAAAEQSGALIITTAKDYVRLPESLKAKVHVFHVALEWQDAQEVLRLLESGLAKRAS